MESVFRRLSARQGSRRATNPYISASAALRESRTRPRSSMSMTFTVIWSPILQISSTFFTGKQKLVDTEGRVDAFRRRYAGTRGAAIANRTAAAPKK